MKQTKLITILPLAALSLGIMAFSARADDHDDGRWDNHNRRHEHHDGTRVDIGVEAPRVAVRFGWPGRIFHRDRPVYVGQDRRYYEGNSIGFQVQRGLARGGYYRGSIDGDVGPGTCASIRAYQLDHGFYPTARINDELLVSLRLR